VSGYPAGDAVPPESDRLPAPGSPADWPFVVASLIGSLALYAAVARWLADVVGPPTVDVTRFLPEVVPFLQPEPLEKLRYLVALVCIPTLPTAIYLGLRSAWQEAGPEAVSQLRAFATDPAVLGRRDAAVAATVVAWLAWLGIKSEIPNAGLLLAVSAIGIAACWIGRPAVGRMLAAAGLDVSPAGVAKHLTGIMDALLVETSDLTPALAAAIAPHVRKSVGAPIVMIDDAARLAVARAVLAVS
jgi:hypothetical protein